MSRTRSMLLLSLSVVLCRPAAADDASCSTSVGHKDGSSQGVDLTLTLDHDRPTGISFEAVFESGQEGGAYFCTFKADAANGKSRWTAGKGTLTVTVLQGQDLDQDPERESTFEISATKDGYLVTFVDMSRTYCGFGAEFPRSVRLVKGKKACVVVSGYP